MYGDFIKVKTYKNMNLEIDWTDIAISSLIGLIITFAYDKLKYKIIGDYSYEGDEENPQCFLLEYKNGLGFKKYEYRPVKPKTSEENHYARISEDKFENIKSKGLKRRGTN
jgi:hypothetical protein